MREKKVEHARRLRKQGKRLKQIAETLGISLATASEYCRGVLPKNMVAPDPRKAETLQLIRELYSNGVPISEIAKQTSIPAPTLYDWRRESGVKRNSRKVYVTEGLRDQIRKKMSRDPDGSMRKEAVRLYQKEQFSTPDIAKNLGVTTVTIGLWLAQEGIERRKRPTRKTREKLRQANLGSKRYNWKGGISDENVRIRTSLQMKLAREACFERDDYTCQSCGQRGGNLNAHHIWPFQRFTELKFEVSNLLTLCKECHDGFHKAAGGHVKVAIGPFFCGQKDWIKEERADYIVSRVRDPLLRPLLFGETGGVRGRV